MATPRSHRSVTPVSCSTHREMRNVEARIGVVGLASRLEFWLEQAGAGLRSGVICAPALVSPSPTYQCPLLGQFQST